MPVAKKGTATKKPTPKSRTVKIAVFGSGELTAKAFKALVTDHLTQFANDDVSFVLPLTKDGFTPTLGIVGDFLTENEIPYETITEKGGARTRALKPYTQNATTNFEVERGFVRKISTVLSGADVAQLFALYDEADEDLDAAMMQAFDKGIQVFNLLDGLDELEPADEDEETESDEEEADEEETEDDAEEEDEEAEDEEEDDEPVTPKSKAKKPVATDDEKEVLGLTPEELEELSQAVAGILAKRLITA